MKKTPTSCLPAINIKTGKTNSTGIKSICQLWLLAIIAALFSTATVQAQSPCINFVSTNGIAGFAGRTEESSKMAVDPSGTPYVLFRDSAYGNKATVMKYDGTSWLTVGSPGFSAGALNVNDYDQIDMSNIAIDGTGKPYIIYANMSDGSKIYVMKYEGGSWVDVSHSTIPTTSTYWKVGIAIDGSNVPYIAYNDFNDDYSYNPLRIMKYNGSSWDPVGTSITNASILQDLKIDKTGTPHIAVAETNASAAVYKFNGASWVRLGSEILSTGNPHFLCMAIDSNNVPYIGFQDENGPYPPVPSMVMKYNGSTWDTVGTYGLRTDADVFINSLIFDSTGTLLAGCRVAGTYWQSSVLRFNGSAWDYAYKGDTANVGAWAEGPVFFGVSLATNNGSTYLLYNKPGTYTYNVAKAYYTLEITAATNNICTGATTTLSSAVVGGTWSSSNSSVATIDSATGIVTGVGAGNTDITYTITNSCGIATATKAITVNAAPSAGTITGASSLAIGTSVTLANATTGGSWSSSAAGIATVGSVTGIVNGIAVGTTIISYTVTGPCGTAIATKTVTVTGSPTTGSLVVCAGATTTLSNAGGTWSSGNQSVATVGITSGVVTGVAAGTATIYYNIPGGTVPSVVTVNAAPANITGTLKACPGTTTTLADAATGGTWTSSNTGTATVDAATGVVTGIAAGSVSISYTNTAGCSKTANVTINPNPSVIMGTLSACAGSNTTLSDATGGGMSWTSSNTAVATVNVYSGVVTGVANGTATITYTISTGCMATAVFTVNALPAAITGTLKTCAGTTTSLDDATTGGTWTSSYAAVATINTSGVVAGIAGGTTTITYSMGAGCNRTAVVTISPLPTAIMGTPATCTGTTATLSNVGSGTWSSSDMSVATVGASGIIAGVAPGTTTISYTVANGCAASVIATVSAAPPASTGAATVCMGSTTTLANATTGGTWASSNNGIATVGSSSGIVTTLSSTGTINITYSLGGSCRTVKNITINAIPNAITGTASICAAAATTLSSSSTGTWSSSNMTVGTIGSISVVSGRFAGLSAGTSVVTYAFATGCARTAIVTVNATPDAGTITSSGGFVINTTTPPTSVMLSSTGDAGGTWTSNNTAVATIGAGTSIVNSVGAGVANISYTVTLGGCSARATHTVNVVAARSANDNSSSIVFAQSEVSIYPNPNRGTFTIKGNVAAEANTEVTINVTDMTGQVIYSTKAVVADGAINEAIQLNKTLASGMYLLTLNSGNDTKVFHFVMQQ